MVYRDYDNEDDADFESLKGKTITEIEGMENGSESVRFFCSDGSQFRLVYFEDCCASCSIEDIAGDVSDLIGSPILLAEAVCSSDPDKSIIAERKKRYDEAIAEDPNNKEYWFGPSPDNDWKEESETWCFYKLGTIKGTVTLRWYGSSNGYYSESATFVRAK